MSLLDRYVFRSFLEPFLLCFSGFIAIWLIIDISDNFNDFLEAHASFKTVFHYYVTQVPTTIMLSMPVGLMLALLFSLSRMSRRNEIISQLVAGRSVTRVLLPLIAMGVAMTGFCLWLNWDRAPHAEGIKKDAINKIKRGKTADEVEPVMGHLFRDRLHNRTWFVHKLRPRLAFLKNVQLTDFLEGVHVTQQNADGRIVKKWYGNAIYDATTQTWKLEKGMIVDFTPEGDVANADRFLVGFRAIKEWTETPMRVASAELDPAFLSVPELEEYLISNSDFPQVQLAPYRANLADRYALPFQCLLAVFIGAPLGIVYNRTGVIGAVTAAVVLLVIMIMSHYFFLMLGKGMRLNPDFSPWIPDIFLSFVGLMLLWYRSTNRDFPKPTFVCVAVLCFGVFVCACYYGVSYFSTHR